MWWGYWWCNNLMLAAFQILPLAPLAGYRALVALLPESADETHQKFQRFAPLLLVVLIASDYVLRPGFCGQPFSRSRSGSAGWLPDTNQPCVLTGRPEPFGVDGHLGYAHRQQRIGGRLHKSGGAAGVA